MIEATRWRDELEARLAAAREKPAPDQVHELRIATRRLAAWLWLGGHRVLVDDLRWLRTVAGAVRDVDVVIELEADPGWSRWLRSERRVRQQALAAALAAERAAALVQALAGLPAVARGEGRERLRKLARRTLASGEALAAEPDDEAAFHRLRRRARLLRYGLEWLGEGTRAFRDFQEVSGAAADRALVLRMLALYPHAGDLAARRAELEAEFADRRRAALATWPALRERVRALR